MPSREADILYIGRGEPDELPLRKGDDLHIRSHERQPDLDSALSYLRMRSGFLLVDGASLLDVATEWEKNLESQLEQSMQLDDWMTERLFLMALALKEARGHLTLTKACSGILDAPAESSVNTTSAVKQISRALRRLDRILAELTLFAEFEIPQPRLNLTDLSLTGTVAQLAKACKVQATSKGLSFNVAYWEPLPERVRVDSARLSHVVHDLMSTAIEFASSGDILVEVAHSGEKLEITVTTTVPAFPFGFEEERTEAIQDPRLDTYRVRMAFGRRIAQWMGGDLITVRSREDKGTGLVLRVKAEVSQKAG